MATPPEFTGPMNLGNQSEFTVLELAEKVVKLSGSRSKIVRARPLPQDDPARRQPDISLAKKTIHWEPKVPLDEGLARTIAWFKTIKLADYRPPTPRY